MHVLVSFSLQRLNFLFDHCRYVHGLAMLLILILLLTASFNAVCLYNAYLFFAIDFYKCFLFSCFVVGLSTQFVYFKYYFASCIVLLVNWFS